MSKAVIVINNCRDCPYIDYKESIRHIYCDKNAYKLRELDNIDERPDWCPLIPEPERIDLDKAVGRMQLARYESWNACLDALEGKT